MAPPPVSKPNPLSLAAGLLLFLFLLFTGAGGDTVDDAVVGGPPGTEAGDGDGARVVSATEDVTDETTGRLIGRIRYHYYDYGHESNNNTSFENQTEYRLGRDVVMMGVGTAMSVGDYDTLGNRVASRSPGTVFVVSDHNPGGIVKTSPEKYADLFNEVRERAGELIPACRRETNGSGETNGTWKTNFYIGGHSASGQAALEAANPEYYYMETPDGFVGLDPYEISSKTMEHGPFLFPTLDWGFTRKTCAVAVDKAAAGAYRLSSVESGRILYSIDNDRGGAGVGEDGIGHCIFTDDGCGVGPLTVCPNKANRRVRDLLHDGVAESIHIFLGEVRERQEWRGGGQDYFSKQRFELPAESYGMASGNGIFLYTAEEEPQVHSQSSSTGCLSLSSFVGVVICLISVASAAVSLWSQISRMK